MNFCQNHWDLLRDDIQKAGLTSLISDDGADLAEKIAKQFNEGEVTLSSYDPLLSAMFALANYCLEIIGPDNAKIVILGEHCPMCAAHEIHEMSCPYLRAAGSSRASSVTPRQMKWNVPRNSWEVACERSH